MLAAPCGIRKHGGAARGDAKCPGTEKAIEQFLSLTAIWMLELEWTHAYVNKTPKAEDFRKAMLAAGLQDCPADFQEAWLKQAAKPGRNYAAPVLRKYGISLKDLRERLQGSLFKIDPGVRPPIPLYDEEEKIPRMDPRTCGNPKDILKALAALRAQVMGLTPAQLEKAARSIERVMLEFTLAYVETSICMNAGGIRESQVRELFSPINTEQCPEDFRRAWRHDLPFFLKGRFTGTELALSPLCKNTAWTNRNCSSACVKNWRNGMSSLPRPGRRPNSAATCRKSGKTCWAAGNNALRTRKTVLPRAGLSPAGPHPSPRYTPTGPAPP